MYVTSEGSVCTHFFCAFSLCFSKLHLNDCMPATGLHLYSSFLFSLTTVLLLLRSHSAFIYFRLFHDY